MDTHTSFLEIASLRQRIESIERELEAGPNNAEELRFQLESYRQLLEERLKPDSVIEAEYRQLMQDYEGGKLIDARVILTEILAANGNR